MPDAIKRRILTRSTEAFYSSQTNISCINSAYAGLFRDILTQTQTEYDHGLREEGRWMWPDKEKKWMHWCFFKRKWLHVWKHGM